MKKYVWIAVLINICLLIGPGSATAQSTEFAFQGRLTDAGVPVAVNYDLRFTLFSQSAGGTAIGTVERTNVPVSNGVFTVKLDFGSTAFDGTARWIETEVKPTGGGAYQPLNPRVFLTTVPYSVRSLTAANATQLGGVAATEFVQTTDPRMTDARPPAPGNGSYIQNRTTAQPASNFNITGTGKANIIDAAIRYDLNGGRVLSNPGTNNLFVGIGAGISNSSGSSNTFLGWASGQNNSTGSNNSFFGREAGKSTQSAVANSFFGSLAGQQNTGGGNSFFGTQAGQNTITGSFNSFYGLAAGNTNSTGGNNVFLGSFAGTINTTGSNNTTLGASSNVSSGGLNFATAIGAGSKVSTSNTIALGRSNGLDLVIVPGELNVSGLGKANILDAAAQFNIGGFRVLTAIYTPADGGSLYLGRDAGGSSPPTGIGNVFVGQKAGQQNTEHNNTFVGFEAGFRYTTGSGNVFIGWRAGGLDTSGSRNVMIGADTRPGVNGSDNTAVGTSAYIAAGNLSFATAIGAGSWVTASNTIQLGRQGQLDRVRISGLGIGGTTSLCLNADREISTCSSSLVYKTNVNYYGSSLDLIKKLRPVSFNWIDGGAADIGLVAEEVAEIEPLLTTTNDKGEIEGVKYDRVGVVLVNAVNEQQQLIETLQKTVLEQKKAIEELRKLVCSIRPEDRACRPE